MMISELNKRAAFKNPTVSKSDSGGTTNVFNVVATVWASFKPKSELIETSGGMSVMESKGEVKVRYTSDLIGVMTKDTRVTIDSIDYTIIGFFHDDSFVSIEVKAVSNGLL
jgi:SPP1 family predicted phage head-tail adaptor